MVQQQLSFEYYIQQGQGVLIRCYGDSPCVTLPSHINGVPLTEICQYCFSEKAPSRLGKVEILRWGQDFSHAICGNFVEKVEFSGGLKKMGSLAFYNCRNLEALSLPSSLEVVEGDAFMNCHALEKIDFDCPHTAISPLRQVGSLIQHNFVAKFADGMSFLFPEYYEELEENTPAHIFNRQVVGVGYRYRRCFQGEVLDVEEYDRSLELASREEAISPLCRLALFRLMAPCPSKNPEPYKNYLAQNLQTALEECVKRQEYEGLEFLVKEFCPSSEILFAVRTLAQKKGDAKASTLLTSTAFSPIKKDYDF